MEPAWVAVDIVYEKSFGALRLPRLYTPLSEGAKKIKGMFWPNDQGTNVKRIETVIVK